jgi:hypothetical protein
MTLQNVLKNGVGRRSWLHDIRRTVLKRIKNGRWRRVPKGIGLCISRGRSAGAKELDI